MTKKTLALKNLSLMTKKTLALKNLSLITKKTLVIKTGLKAIYINCFRDLLLNLLLPLNKQDWKCCSVWLSALKTRFLGRFLSQYWLKIMIQIYS